MTRFKKGPFLALAIIVLGGFGFRYALQHGYLGPSSSGPAKLGEVAAESEEEKVAATVLAAPAPRPAVPLGDLPTMTPVAVAGPQVRVLGMAWNAQLGLAFANGGETPMAGSLMAKHGVNLAFNVQNDCNVMATQLVAFAKELHSGNPYPSGDKYANFVIVMGDGSGAFVASMLPELSALGPEYIPEAFGSPGYSRGEDKLMGQPEWVNNPKLLRGSLISGYLRDGDWNIALKFATDNGVLNNPDEKTWDPEAMNWYSADDFLKAADAYNNNVCQDRPVVHAGKRVNETKHICVNGVVTWTPGDVNIAKGRGGLVSVISTKQYTQQMPATVIGIQKWNRDNRKLIDNFLAAMYEGGDQVNANPAALSRGAQAEAAIYHDQTAAYWERYFRGTTEPDKTGLAVELGGSTANGLQDAMRLYGLTPGVPNLFAATYTRFGNLAKQQYPKLIPTLVPVEKVLNVTYTMDLAKVNQTATVRAAPAAAPTFTRTAEIQKVVSNRAWQINFDSGKATFTPQALQQLELMKQDLLIAEDLLIQIQGHTDDTGNPDNNRTLSLARANAVRTWLMSQGAGSFNQDRFAKPKGFGSDKPVASNDTDSGKAKNRRVEVILGS
jgi:OOP family OmpA-OmpF porin